MKSFFDVLKTMFCRKNAKSYGTPDRSRKEPVTQQKVQIRNTVRWIKEWIRKISY